ncbi:MAG TPA: efflux RND transporter periplasmic adaptor subunit [Phycisphaerae bacterium]|nr:efflux RND transporter periplasmic adaptor subunit [Phycisphaerae bacterium]
MAAPPDIRSQLRTLSIPKERRPVAAAPATVSHRHYRRIILLGGLTGALAFGLYFAARQWGGLPGASAKADEIRLHVVTARKAGEPLPVLTATGKIVSDHKVQVSTKVSGQIVALHFEQGDRVKEGQVLARIEDVIYKARRDQAAANLEKSRANYEYQKINFERMARLFEGKNAPTIEHADAKRALEEAKAQAAADEAALAWAQKALTDCDVIAPIAGVILQRDVEVGDFVAAEGGRGMMANAQFGMIADMATLRVEVDISELDIAKVKKDMPCTITPDAYKDRRYRGHVLWIDPGANYSKATVQVKVRIDDPDDNLRVEGSAQVAFLSEPPPAESPSGGSAIWIPASSCQRDADAKSARVFLVDNGRLRQTPIRIGREVSGLVEVLGGLTPGQSIAIDGLDHLSDGMRVRS